MSVVIPAGTALPVLLAALPPVAEVIVVVGRDDDTGIATPRVTRVVRQTRTGVGNALACGVAVATGDIVAVLAGDGSCDPAELPRYLRALRDGADVAQGSRFHHDGRDLCGGRLSRLSARILLWFMTVLFGCRRTDPGCGFRAFWRDVATSVGLPRVAGTDPVRGDGLEIEALMTVRAGLAGLLVTEVPAVAYPRTAPAARPGLTPAVRALVAEHAERRRAARAGEADSIVVLTGRGVGAGLLGRTGTDAGPLPGGPAAGGTFRADAGGRGTFRADAGGRGTFRADASGRGGTDAGHGGINRVRAGRDRLPVAGDVAARWPATNSRVAAPDRARAAQPDRRTAGGPVVAPRVGDTPGEAPTVRGPWRDNLGTDPGREVGAGRRRLQGRPNLRVINGEGGGGDRTGRLRAVPPADRDR
ncbi:glycosyltransferase family 2 protein [Actinoplanes teichomyceticus]|uniref:glycosyltransferase family 2 protein n=1 Tax=Actinoplanes teichomyceticus TaxID=1867 RepID=UPI000F0A8451|nr:glycosyltransferase family 2 protein [Actinoplanes teichomyceticus]